MRVKSELAETNVCTTEYLHGGMEQEDRNQVYEKFKNGKLQVLVATGVASRGLDFPNVDLIIHFNPPDEKETYLHASGRTGRAGKKGISVILHKHRYHFGLIFKLIEIRLVID